MNKLHLWLSGWFARDMERGRSLPARLVRRFVHNWAAVDRPETRKGYGTLSGAVGILLNVLLAGGKLAAGVVTGSLSVTADALNNLTDAASSVVTLVGFRVAGQRADEGHPFGHGRAEYISGFLVSLLILLTALGVGKSSVERVLAPAPVTFSWLAMAILAASILVKLWIWRFNRGLEACLSSEALGITAQDALGDCVATLVVLLGAASGRLGVPRLDGIVGLGVAVFIARAGLGAARDTLDRLMGKPPAQEVVQKIADTVLETPEITGIHDLVVHEYGPGHLFATIHAELPADMDLVTAHAAADRAERVLLERCGVQAVIHVDPVPPAEG